MKDGYIRIHSGTEGNATATSTPGSSRQAMWATISTARRLPQPALAAWPRWMRRNTWTTSRPRPSARDVAPDPALSETSSRPPVRPWSTPMAYWLRAATSPRAPAAGYRRGIFPWYEEPQPVLWWTPDPRSVLFPDELHISRSLRKTLRQRHFDLAVDTNVQSGHARVRAAARRRPGHLDRRRHDGSL